MIETINDGRVPLDSLYDKYSRLELIQEEIYRQNEETNGRKIEMPILAFRSLKKGKSLWLIAGIHGEEPAGVNAVYRNIDLINKYAQAFPVVLIPCANPKGYRKDWRYPDREEMVLEDPVPSVGSSDHIVLNGSDKPRWPVPTCPEAEALNRFMLITIGDYPPFITMDLHEDESNVYVYSHGKLGKNDPVAINALDIARDCGAKIQFSGETLFHEPIRNGIVEGSRDGSISDFFSSRRIYVNGEIVPGPCARSVVVVETPQDLDLERRVEIHSRVIKSLGRFMS